VEVCRSARVVVGVARPMTSQEGMRLCCNLCWKELKVLRAHRRTTPSRTPAPHPILRMPKSHQESDQ